MQLPGRQWRQVLLLTWMREGIGDGHGGRCGFSGGGRTREWPAQHDAAGRQQRFREVHPSLSHFQVQDAKLDDVSYSAFI